MDELTNNNVKLKSNAYMYTSKQCIHLIKTSWLYVTMSYTLDITLFKGIRMHNIQYISVHNF